MDDNLGTFGRILGSENDPFLSQKRRRKLIQNLGRKKGENGCQKLIRWNPPAECAGPMEDSILEPQPLVVLTRHLWGGRSEDACGEVTGHPTGNNAKP